MKIPIISDIHIGARNDSPIILEQSIQFFEQQFIPYLQNNNTQHVLFAGDLTDHRKVIKFHTLQEWRNRVFDIITRQCQFHAIYGNHDLAYKNVNEIISIEEILGHNSNVLLYKKPTEITFDETKVLMCPWILPGEEAKFINEISKSSAQVCLGHFDIIGFEMNGNILNKEHGFQYDVFENFQMVISGHYHKKHSKKNIHYVGSPYEMDWSDWGNLHGFHILDTETRELQFIENKNKLFHKIFYKENMEETKKDLKNCYVKIIVEEKNNPKAYERFLESIFDMQPCDVDIIDYAVLEQPVEEDIDTSKDTLSFMKEYLSSLNISNEDNLMQLFGSLYQEALSLGYEES